MTHEYRKYDIAIIGSGIVGSALGAILARHNINVIIFEAKSHPRFSIGESMILETSEAMRAVAELYDVPELAYFSSENFFAHIGTSHGVKRHFSFLYHESNQVHDQRRTLQAIIPKQPHGHELHLYRQDADYFVMTTAIRYGATVRQNTAVQNVEIGDNGVTIITEAGQSVQANYIVDAGGFRSILADKFDLRDFNLRTHSRAIFTHMIDVPDFHQPGSSQKDYSLPYSVAEGTLHHVFRGGWLWVIPFNNHARSTNPLCSVGLMLDPRIHPPKDHLTAEEEFFSFIEQFPSIQEQLLKGKAVRDWTRTGRIQYASKQVVGDRYSLLGHAAGFIDPLFSKGLYCSWASLSILADLLLKAQTTGDYSRLAFRPLEAVTLSYIHTNDRLIANAYKAFSHYKLWNAYSVLWLLGAYTEYVKLTTARGMSENRDTYYHSMYSLKLTGGGFPEFDKVANKIDSLIEQVDPMNISEVDQVVAEIRTCLLEIAWLPTPFADVLDGKTYLPKNKLRLSLLNRNSGFMGQGAYRTHFFGADASISALIKGFLREKVRYSGLSLAKRRRLQFQ